MFVPVCSTVSSILIPMLGPLDLCKLRRVNRQMAVSITPSDVDDAMENCMRPVVLSDDTVRIQSRSGKTVIELILPRGDGMKSNKIFKLYMQLDGKLYHGWVEPWMCVIKGVEDNFARYIFHDKSTRLFGAGSVAITECRSIYGKRHRQVELFVDKNETDGWTFTLHFYEVSPGN